MSNGDNSVDSVLFVCQIINFLYFDGMIMMMMMMNGADE